MPRKISCGPLLFSIYINDLPLYITPHNTDLFAYDDTITVNGSDINSQMSNDLMNINKWCT